MPTDDVLRTADRLWEGELTTDHVHPMGPPPDLAEVADGTAFVPSFANAVAVAGDDGLLLVDTGSPFTGKGIHEQVRRWSPTRLDVAVYTHGHIDHVMGTTLWDDEAAERGWEPPSVVAHEAVPARFDRYVATAGYNGAVNRRQFGLDHLTWPTRYRYPDRTYRDRLDLDLGGVPVEIHHGLGETDDHSWLWFPASRTLCTGDLFIWASPNAGNPQKVQRFPREWAASLRTMAALADRPGGGPRVLLPGHGYPIVGEDRVQRALTETAELLESLVDQTLALMNEGARLDEILHTVAAPSHLLERPYLRPVYDEPEFVVHAVWHRYGGWWDGNPASLKPAPEAALARELADLAGGPGALAGRARALLDDGDDGALRLAGHLAELAWLADPADEAARATRREVNGARAAAASSTMARGIFSAAGREA